MGRSRLRCNYRLNVKMKYMKSGVLYMGCCSRLLLLLPFLLGNCKKEWLDQKTNTNLAVPSTLSDFQTLVDNTDVMNANGCAIGEIGSDGHFIFPGSWTPESPQEQNAYTWSHDKPNVVSYDWDDAYKRVAYCNVILEGLQGINPVSRSDRQTWNALKGNALFERARSFFELAQVYAPPYTDSAAGNWGIPLKLVSDIHAPTTRPTVPAVYSQVIADLMGAKDLLPLTVAYKTRASKQAAMALLARVYLAMEKYDLAWLYADSCLQLPHWLLDYHVLKLSADPYPADKFNSEVIFHSTLFNWGNITVDAFIDSAQLALYDSNDLRRAVFFNQDLSGNTYFGGSYNKNATLFSGLAFDELYLTRAECNARKGNIADAKNDMDTLLLRRMNSYTPFAPGDADLLARILQERQKELLLRGLRWPDLRRLNRNPVFARSLTRAINGKVDTLLPNSFRYTFPIPDDIIQVSGIAQNPGW